MDPKVRLSNGTAKADDVPVYLSQDHTTENHDEEMLDRMAMDSFPASDPPSFSATAVGTPLRGKGREPQPARDRRSATPVALLRDMRTIVVSAFRIARARVRAIARRSAPV